MLSSGISFLQVAKIIVKFMFVLVEAIQCVFSQMKVLHSVSLMRNYAF